MIKIKDFVSKLQNLPIKWRKIILWSIVVVLGIIMVFFWIKSIGVRIENINTGEFIGQLNLPPIGEKIQGVKEQIDLTGIKNKLGNDPELLKELKKELTPEEWQELQKELQ